MSKRVVVEVSEPVARAFLKLCKKAEYLTSETLFVIQQIESQISGNCQRSVIEWHPRHSVKDCFPADETAIYLIRYDGDYFLGYFSPDLDSVVCFGINDEQFGLHKGANFEYVPLKYNSELNEQGNKYFSE